ncbi:hypothetical protein SCLARK_00928 [Spiroplasma clarkii]|uniref:Lipoprotein n=1 Tax=Spiroplasma clarkii TaxID=2139 RepID=A0A1Y0L0M3_9MOLU|nr:hypothetical protein [Spiroplasma clarkii]ARU91536.1 hypothetical protein SCLARK_00928 [Spiroplasma clarkii]ATX70942.1 hypothetical protein SCLAR_v1c06230 [Spiroplasma clarkii]
MKRILKYLASLSLLAQLTTVTIACSKSRGPEVLDGLWITVGEKYDEIAKKINNKLENVVYQYELTVRNSSNSELKFDKNYQAFVGDKFNFKVIHKENAEPKTKTILVIDGREEFTKSLLGTLKNNLYVNHSLDDLKKFVFEKNLEIHYQQDYLVYLKIDNKYQLVAEDYYFQTNDIVMFEAKTATSYYVSGNFEFTPKDKRLDLAEFDFTSSIGQGWNDIRIEIALMKITEVDDAIDWVDIKICRDNTSFDLDNRYEALEGDILLIKPSEHSLKFKNSNQTKVVFKKFATSYFLNWTTIRVGWTLQKTKAHLYDVVIKKLEYFANPDYLFEEDEIQITINGSTDLSPDYQLKKSDEIYISINTSLMEGTIKKEAQ